MIKISVILFWVLTSLQGFTQNRSDTIRPEDYNLDSLKKIYGNKKFFIPGLELQSLVALSHYPELKNAHITFKLANKEGTAKTTFTFFSVFKTSGKHFIIYINQQKNVTGFLFTDISFSGQVGAIGHELAHVLDFNHKGFFGMAWWGISYLNKNKRRHIEHATDRQTIDHGLGWELYDFNRFIYLNESTTEKYMAFRREYYLNTEDVLDRISIVNEHLQ